MRNREEGMGKVESSDTGIRGGGMASRGIDF